MLILTDWVLGNLRKSGHGNLDILRRDVMTVQNDCFSRPFAFTEKTDSEIMQRLSVFISLQSVSFLAK